MSNPTVALSIIADDIIKDNPNVSMINIGNSLALWESIKYAALDTDDVPDDVRNVYCENLLQDLLADKRSCYVAKRDGKINLIIILSFEMNTLTGTRVMNISNLYSELQTQENLPGTRESSPVRFPRGIRFQSTS